MRRPSRPALRLISGLAVASAWTTALAVAQPPAPAPAAAAAPAAGSAASPGERRLDRLVHLCTAWNAVKYLEPSLWSSKVDWDKAFVQAATAVDGSSPTPAYRAIAERMLQAVGDPGTRVLAAAASEADTGAAPSHDGEVVRQLGDGIVLVDMVAAVRTGGNFSVGALATRLSAVTAQASGLIVDLRYRGEEGELGDYRLSAVGPRLVPRAVRVPAREWVLHSGYEPQQGSASGGYFSGLVTGRSTEIAPAGLGGAWRVVFLVNGSSPMSDVVRALLASGDARLVANGTFDPAASGEATTDVDLGEGLRAQVVTQTSVGAPSVGATVVASGGAKDDPALTAAREMLAKPWAPVAAAPSSVAEPPVRSVEKSYPEAPYPPLGLRLLAGCRAWGVIHYFYPYLPLIGDWDGAFHDSLTPLTEAADEDAYTRAILLLMAHVEDGHTGVWGTPSADRVLAGEGDPPLRARFVEDRPAVVAISPQVHGVQLGDVIEAVDGEPLAARIARLSPLVPAATAEAQRNRTLHYALEGPNGSRAALRLVGADGKARTVEVERLPEAPSLGGTGPIWRRLQPRIGYADLRRLQIGQVDPMLEDLRDTDALILDMRGYPNGTAWPLAARLNIRGAKIGALFRRNEVSGATTDPEMGSAGLLFEQPLPPPRSWTYRGKVAMLIDGRAISQAEHTCLFLEQAAGATFIGTPTAGSNGDVTNFPLPGGLQAYFTGHDIRHADGRQLQRVGIQPDIRVEPTLAGLRGGRDEVLERAVAWAEEAIAKAPPSTNGKER